VIDRSNRVQATKIAVIATAIGMGCYILSVLIFNVLLIDRMTSQVDTRLNQRLAFAIKDGGRAEESINGSTTRHAGDPDDDDAPIFVWRVGASGVATPITSGAPSLVTQTWAVGERTLTLGHSTFRVTAARFKSGWLVAAESLADVQKVKDTLLVAELIFAAVLMFLMFGAAFVVGIRALAPIALAQRRQTKFTADASHELRTPLSVIEAEVEIALSRDRDAESYRSTIARIGDEGGRLRRIVEDLMWLARSDAERTKARDDESVDVVAVAAACTKRFEPVAQTKNLRLSFAVHGAPTATVRASAESIDRLVGVLLDNACKFADEGGQVDVVVATPGSNVELTVDDSGPGIAADERPLIFDRFHRASSESGGSGLGLAIADSIIRATQATCSISTAPLGGARFDVVWHHHAPRLET